MQSSLRLSRPDEAPFQSSGAIAGLHGLGEPAEPVSILRRGTANKARRSSSPAAFAIPSAVRKGGLIFIAINREDFSLAGMMIIIPPSSKARVIAENSECEMHLLGVKSEFRGLGIGRL